MKTDLGRISEGTPVNGKTLVNVQYNFIWYYIEDSAY